MTSIDVDWQPAGQSQGTRSDALASKQGLPSPVLAGSMASESLVTLVRTDEHAWVRGHQPAANQLVTCSTSMRSMGRCSRSWSSYCG
jgi:hypothetical protein